MRRRTAALLWYLVLAFGISWSGVALAASQDSVSLLFVAMLLGPSLASIGLTAALHHVQGLRVLARRMIHWRVGARWYAALAIAPGLMIVVLSMLSAASPSFLPDLAAGESPRRVIVSALIVGLSAGVFEELGWTGFAAPRLLRRHAWFPAGVLLGLVWALWHVPADFAGRAEHDPLWLAHVAQWIVALTAFRVLMTWIYSRTQSLLLAMLLHASFTGSQVLLWPGGASPADELLWYGAFACGLWAVVAGVTAVVGGARATA